jgi:effector-binding domain-containing protein
MDEPVVVERGEQAYVGITAVVTMAMISSTLPPLISQVFGWLGGRGIAPVGPPFWRYDVVDMVNGLTVVVGVPVADVVPVADGEPVTAGVLPGGKYVTVTHVGDPSGLMAATGELLAWAERAGLAWDVTGQRWGCRLEEYLTDPAEQPDRARWATRLAFKLA